MFLFCLKQLKNVPFSQIRHIYSPSVFGMKYFESLRQNKKLTIGKQFQDLKQRLKNSLDKKNVDELDIVDLNDYIVQIENNEEDFNLGVDVFKLFLKENYLIDEKNFGELLIKTDFLLNRNVDKTIQLLGDKQLLPSIMTQLTSFVLLIKLYNEKRYEQVYECFMIYIEYLDEKIKRELKPSKYKIKSQKQLITFGQLRIVAASLLRLNTKDSLDKVRTLFRIASDFDSNLNNTALASCFLLAINHNETDFALQIASKINKTNITLKNNLAAIAYCHENKLTEAVQAVERILSCKEDQMGKFNGKVFNLTLNNFKELNLKHSDKKNAILIEKMTARMFHIDLYDFCTETHSGYSVNKI